MSCVEEIAYRMGYINAEQLSQLAKSLNGNGYEYYLLDILEDMPSTARRREPVGVHRGEPSSTAFQH